MKNRTAKIIGIIASIMLVFFMIMSVFMKLTVKPDDEMGKLFQSIGIFDLRYFLSILEIIIIIVFLIPRTSFLGYLLIISYWAGAFATVLTHGQIAYEHAIPISLVAIIGITRFPELFYRLKNKEL